MRVQLIHPPIYVNLRAMQATRPSLPLGLAYIAAALRADGHRVSVLDAVQRCPERLTADGPLHYYGLGPEEIAEAVDPDADIIGVSAMFSFAWPLVRQIIHRVRERSPHNIIVGGGEHFTGLPELSLETAPLDYLVLGEGEDTIRELLRALDAGHTDVDSVAGLAFLREGRMVRTTPRARISDLAALPWPAWDLFEPAGYYRQGHVMGVDAGMTMPILATRGCPYGCTFCSNAMMWHRRWYARDPVSVVDEIAFYNQRYAATNFPFHDLTAILKKDWILAFCRELDRRGLSITWQLPGGTRCEVIDDEVAEWFQRTGGKSLTLAPESGSERIRSLVGKQITEPALMRAVRTLTRRKLNVSAFLVIGFPQETLEDLRQTVRLAFRLAAAGVNDIALNCFFPIPGTRLFEDLERSGRLQVSDQTLQAPIFSMNAAIPPEYNFCEAVDARRLTRMKYHILLAFYLTSFVIRPWRVFQLTWNVIRGRETCKLDIFLIERKRRWLRHPRG
jgi:radical SAM superfamily enzyme YgiQ (UPF0313 family)